MTVGHWNRDGFSLGRPVSLPVTVAAAAALAAVARGRRGPGRRRGAGLAASRRVTSPRSPARRPLWLHCLCISSLARSRIVGYFLFASLGLWLPARVGPGSGRERDHRARAGPSVSKRWCSVYGGFETCQAFIDMIITLTAIALVLGAAWYLLKDNTTSSVASNHRLTTGQFSTPPINSIRQEKASKSNNIRGPNVSFYFASQRGTAQEFAESLAKQGSLRNLNSSPRDLEIFRYTCISLKYGFQILMRIFSPDDFKSDTCSIFLIATHGEGEPTGDIVQIQT